MQLKPFIKKIFRPILQPASRWYLSKERNFTYKELNIKVFPGIFYPGINGSSKILLHFLSDKKLKNRTFLDLGAGTGMIGLFAAKKGARVTASDINQTALANTKINAGINNVWVDTVYSDLFKYMPVKTYDWIVINPPVIPEDPKDESDYSWYCGENFDYFRKLFSQLSRYMNQQSTVIITLPESSNIRFIKSMGSDYQWEKHHEEEFWDETYYIFQLTVQKENKAVT